MTEITINGITIGLGYIRNLSANFVRLENLMGENLSITQKIDTYKKELERTYSFLRINENKILEIQKSIEHILKESK